MKRLLVLASSVALGAMTLVIVAISPSAVSPTAIGTSTARAVGEFSMDGADARLRPSSKPAIEAAFPRESYRSGSVARLVIFSRIARNVSVQLFHAGTEDRPIKPRDEMYGSAITGITRLGTVRKNQVVLVSIPDSHGGLLGKVTTRLRTMRKKQGFHVALPSLRGGLYFAKLTGSGNRVGYAPFILRPRRPGVNRVAVVLPTLSWQAYNFRDDNGDGQADTWYASAKVKSVLLGRPFDQRGVPRTTSTTSSRSFGGWSRTTRESITSPSRTWPGRMAGSSPPPTTCSSSPAITST